MESFYNNNYDDIKVTNVNGRSFNEIRTKNRKIERNNENQILLLVGLFFEACEPIWTLNFDEVE